MDFEKRIAAIYQNCRSEEEIQASFDALQMEMEESIQERMNLTKQQLLDHFDEAVHEKLRVSLEQSKEYLNKYENWLWLITKQYLNDHASFSEEGGYDFILHQSPFPQVETGRYRIGKYITDAHTYRIGHPLAQQIIHNCKATTLSTNHLHFDYSGTRKIITILEPFVGKSGWLQVVNLTISSFEEEDHVLFAAFSDEGTALDEEQCHRLFSLEGKVYSVDNTIIPRKELTANIQQQTKQITQVNMERNANFFDDEMDKLDHWAEDKRKSLKKELKELDEEIRIAKRQARTARSLPEKLSIQKKVRAREQKREQAWKDYEVESRNIESQKDKLIERIEQQLNHHISKQEVFTIRWTLI